MWGVVADLTKGKKDGSIGNQNVNYIKTRTLNSRFFSKLYKQQHKQLRSFCGYKNQILLLHEVCMLCAINHIRPVSQYAPGCLRFQFVKSTSVLISFTDLFEIF